MFWMMAVFRFSQVQQKNQEDKFFLHVQSSVGTDRGKYVITATNEMGNDTGVINVVVMGSYTLLCFDWLLVCSEIFWVILCVTATAVHFFDIRASIYDIHK